MVGVGGGPRPDRRLVDRSGAGRYRHRPGKGDPSSGGDRLSHSHNLSHLLNPRSEHPAVLEGASPSARDVIWAAPTTTGGRRVARSSLCVKPAGRAHSTDARHRSTELLDGAQHTTSSGGRTAL